MSLAEVACCAAFGAVGGGVLPRVAHRVSVPWGSPTRTACAACGATFPLGMTGWLRLGRPCGCPGRPGPALQWTVLAGAVAATVPAAAFHGVELAVYAVAGVLGVLLAAVDLRCLRLPDILVAALALLTVVPLAGVAFAAGEPSRLGRALAAAALCFGVYLTLAVLPGGGLGFGDVKLGAVLGFLLGWVGWSAVVVGLVAPQLMNGPVAAFLLLTRRVGRTAALPFGPALLAGTLIAVGLAA